MPNFNLEHIAGNSSKILNSFFQDGYIIGFAQTGDVVGVYYNRKMGRTQWKPQGSMFVLPSTPFHNFTNKLNDQSYQKKELKARYPNCRIRIVDLDNQKHSVLSYSFIREVASFLGKPEVAAAAFAPSSAYNRHLRKPMDFGPLEDYLNSTMSDTPLIPGMK